MVNQTEQLNKNLFVDARNFCVTCAKRIRSYSNQYRRFLFEPASLATLVSAMLLLAALSFNPEGLFYGKTASSQGFFLYVACAFIGSAFIWYSALQGIRRRDFTADIPVSVATAAAIAIGQYPAAAVVSVLLLLGGMLENFVAARSGKALESIEKLLPDRVTKRMNEKDIVVRLEEVVVGDILLVRSGERIPVDGRVLRGSATINESAITGESMLVERQPGGSVFAGSLVELGALEVETTTIGQETTLGRIRRMIIEAQLEKAPVERILNRYAKLYTPAALLLGLGLWWWSGDILRAITMLIVFCPCVMVLATPTALVASIGNAALRGSLVKRGATIENFAKIDTIIFDKTGTLTYGKPKLTEIIPLGSMDEAQILYWAAVAEKFSEHSLGQAVLKLADASAIHPADPIDFQPLPGMGVLAHLDSHEIILGKSSLLLSLGVTMPDSITVKELPQARRGCTAISMAADKKLQGILVFEDHIREDARAIINDFRSMGIRTLLVTGDIAMPAQYAGDLLGINDVHAEMLPQDKVEIVRRFQKENHSVAFVGDGVNDGPALAVSDVGVAMGITGTDVAIETAEITLLSDDLSKLPELVRLARKAMEAIRQNLYFSLGVLVVAVVLTTIGVLTPITGALLHELSSIPVIANSARLIGWRS